MLFFICEHKYKKGYSLSMFVADDFLSCQIEGEMGGVVFSHLFFIDIFFFGFLV